MHKTIQKRSRFRLNAVTAAVLFTFSPFSHASMVRADIDFQYFRDFAENKGAFQVGVRNINIKNKSGQSVGTMLPNVPMIDFSGVDRTGIATAVHHQYVTSVMHNRGYGWSNFGYPGNHPEQHLFNYLIVDRNNYDKKDVSEDYHVPRMHKFMTEVITYPTASNEENVENYKNQRRYPVALRIGSGSQAVRDHNNKITSLAGAYHFLTAGNPLDIFGNRPHWFDTKNETLTKGKYGPMPTYAMPGDSGSPMFLYDREQKRWILAGVVRAYSGNDYLQNIYVISRPKFIAEKIREDNGAEIRNPTAKALYHWRALGNQSQITSSTSKVNLALADQSKRAQDSKIERPSLNHGKNLILSGQPLTLKLLNDIDQGAGGLYFHTHAKVESDQDAHWQGAGIYVSQGKQVEWKVKNPKGDRLSKLGSGTLYVNGSGENQGDISVGEGKVVLDYQAKGGKKQAFNQVGIVSGRPTVVLNSADQVNPNNIYFGFRGGRLDLNGNRLTFNTIQNVDDGAKIVNHHKQREATVHLNPARNLTSVAFNGYLGEYASNLTNGKLHFYFDPKNAKSTLLMSGGTQLNGKFQVENGRVVLSGRPTPHAYDFVHKKDVVFDNDWINRQFKANQFVLNRQSELHVGRNVTALNGDLVANQQAKIHLGFKQKQTPICERSDFSGKVSCSIRTIADTIFAQLPTTQVHGNVQLNDRGQLIMGKAHLQGRIQGSLASFVQLDRHSHWTMTGSSQLGYLEMQDAHINLSPENSTKYNQLIINGNLSGSGTFKYATNAEKGLGDRVIVNGLAQGDYRLSVKNTGKDPQSASPLSLFKLNHPNQSKDRIRIRLENGYVDLGAYRYILANHHHDYRLYSPLKDFEISQKQSLQQVKAQIKKAEEEAKRYQQSIVNLNRDISNTQKQLTSKNSEVNKLETEKRRWEKQIAQVKNNWWLTPWLKEITIKSHQTQINKIVNKLKGVYQAKQKLEQSVKQRQTSIHQAEAKIAGLNQSIQNQKQAVFSKMSELSQGACTAGKGDLACANLVDIGATSADRFNRFVQQIALVDQLETLVATMQANAEQLLPQEQEELAQLQNRLAAERALEENLQQDMIEQFDTHELADYIAELTSPSANKIAQKLGISRHTNSALSELSAQFQSLLQTERNLTREILTARQGEWNLWSNIEWLNTQHSANDYRNYDYRHHLNQLGIERKVAEGRHVGAIFSHNESQSTFSEKVNGKGKLNQITVYAKQQWQNGLLFTVDANVANAKNQLQFEQHKVHVRRDIYALGIHLARDHHWSGWQITPYIGTKYYHLRSTDYDLAESHIQQPSQNLLGYRAGVKVQKAFRIADWQLAPHFSLDYHYNQQKKVALKVEHHRFTQSLDNNVKAEIGLRANYHNWTIASHIGWLKGEQIDRQRYLGIKVGYAW